jgi:hypothetical protein
MKANSVAVVVLSMVLTGIASAQNSFLYDDFSQPLLNSHKWAMIDTCFSSNNQEMECIRGVQDGALLLAHRNFGQRDSDVGSQFGGAFVNFINPGLIKSITADVVVRDIEESPCAANPELGGAVHIDGTFFNAGSGNSTDDVGAQFGFSRRVSDPKGQIQIWALIFQDFNYFGFVSLGFVSLGTPVTATLAWDQPNHQFIASATNNVTHAKKRVLLPYTMSDTTAATNPAKDFSVNNFPANCTNNPTWVYADATFDNVYVAK